MPGLTPGRVPEVDPSPMVPFIRESVQFGSVLVAQPPPGVTAVPPVRLMMQFGSVVEVQPLPGVTAPPLFNVPGPCAPGVSVRVCASVTPLPSANTEAIIIVLNMSLSSLLRVGNAP